MFGWFKRHKFIKTSFNRKYCTTCGQEQRLMRDYWHDFGPLSISPDVCNAEKKEILRETYYVPEEI